MKNFIEDFKEFAMKGSVVDLAVGVIIGGAFGKIVSSLVNDIIMPPIGLLINGIDFKNLKWVMNYKADGAPGAVFAYGSFIQNIIEFIIIAFVVFLVVKAMSSLKRSKPVEVAPSATPEETVLLREIRDLLKK